MNVRKWTVALLVSAVFVSIAFAGEGHGTVTVTGKLECAQCSLHKADAKGCQNVLVATRDGQTVEYYLARTTAAQKVGYGCSGTKTVTATGAVALKDGKRWLEAESVELVSKG